MTAPVAVSNLDTISKQQVKDRLKDLNHETPIIYTTSFIKEPQEITLRTCTRNNIMLDKVIENQETIIKNQKAIMNKLGAKLDIEA